MKMGYKRSLYRKKTVPNGYNDAYGELHSGKFTKEKENKKKKKINKKK